MKIICSALILLVALMISFLQACAAAPPMAIQPSKITLITRGYGYQVGDIVRIDTQKKPALGDIVQFDTELNKSDCGVIEGFRHHVTKIIGLPGDTVSFQQWSYQANGYEVTQERYYECNGTTCEHWPETKQVMWGNEKFEHVAGMELREPADEYLADGWIGYECTGEIDEGGSSKMYNRFTVKQQAITALLPLSIISKVIILVTLSAAVGLITWLLVTRGRRAK